MQRPNNGAEIDPLLNSVQYLREWGREHSPAMSLEFTMF